MRVIKYLILALAFLLLVAYLAGFFLPDQAHVARSIEINQPPEKVFAVLNNPRQFNRWSPWYQANKKFGTTYSYHGPETGVGASIQWHTPRDLAGGGSGEMKITRSHPHDAVVYTLLFENREPTSTGFRIQSLPENRSRVTWAYDAEFGRSIIGRYFGLVLDKAVGPDYEAGLKNLKNLLEDAQPESVNTPQAMEKQGASNSAVRPLNQSPSV